MTHFLVACDKCKGSLSAFEMCNLAESVLSERFPTSDVTKVPLTDGGEGFCGILTLGVQGVLHSIEVLDSVGRKKKDERREFRSGCVRSESLSHLYELVHSTLSVEPLFVTPPKARPSGAG